MLDTAKFSPATSPRLSANPLKSFFAFNVDDRGGVRVAVKDVNGDGQLDLIAGSGASGP